MRWLGGVMVTVAGAFAFAASPVLAADHQVAVSNFAYTPGTVTVTQGDSVTWRNTGGTHDVNFDDGSFQQPMPFSDTAWTVTRLFDAPGTYRYHCSVHADVMQGTVVVSEATQPAPGGAGQPVSSGGTGALGEQQPAACTSQRNFRIRIRQPRGLKIASAQVSVNGKPVEVSKLVIKGKLRHTAQVDLRGLRKGTYEVRIVARTTSGKTLRGTRTYQTCSSKLTSSSLPPL